MLLLMMLVGYTAIVHGRGVSHALWLAVGWDAREGNVGFMALVRVRAVILLLSTYLMH